MARTMPAGRQKAQTWAAYAACPWGLLFAALLALRGLIGVIQLGLVALDIVSEQEDDMSPLQIAIEPWFLLGGILFGLVAWYEQRRSR